ncbi:MAG: tetratricopeptide repeat protein [Bacteroidia bacterium]
MLKHKFILALLLFPLITLAGSEDYFAIGNNLYKEGKYKEAIESYQKLINDNFYSFELYYNLGNCYYKLQEYPKAILYYEKAKKINAADEELLHNLKLANTHIKDKVEELPQLFITSVINELIKSKTADRWGWLAIKTMLLALAGFLLFLFSSNSLYKKIGFFSGIAIVILSILFTILGFEQKKNEVDNSYAILMAPSVNVLSSPDEKATRLFVIHEGIKVKITNKENDWIQIKLSNGNSGWIKAADVEQI